MLEVRIFNIFNRLNNINTCVYVTINERVTIKCLNEDLINDFQSEKSEITLNPKC